MSKTKFNISNIVTSPKLERDGVWHETGTSLSLLIARAGNTEYLAELRKQILANAEDSNSNAEENAIIQALASHVLRCWKGLFINLSDFEEFGLEHVDSELKTDEEQDDGLIEVHYTPENAFKMLTHVPDFYRLVMRLSNDSSRFREVAINTQAKG